MKDAVGYTILGPEILKHLYGTVVLRLEVERPPRDCRSYRNKSFDLNYPRANP